MDENVENVERLESAIQQISNVKHNLHKNSAEVKSQIHTSISRLLETLRSREVWLLNQVDLIVSAKEEVLHHQQAGLNKQLGILQSSQGEGATERFEIGDLKPEETPFIDFRADPATLRDRIVNYGRVGVTGVPPKSVFVSPGNPSSSLPRHFEEYEDLDHHVLYKTVEEVSRTKTSDTCVYVSFPRLSSRTEDWLAQTKTSTSTMSQPKFSFSPFSDNTSDWLHHEDCTDKSQIVTSTTCFTESVVSTKPIPSIRSEPSFQKSTANASIQSWLQQIKQNPDLEEDDDFELVENAESLGSLEDLATVSQSEICISSSKSAPQLKLWSSNQIDDLSVWLKSDDKKLEQTGQKTDLFKQFTTSKPADTKIWLAPKDVKKAEKISCFGDNCKMTLFPMEIENLGDFGCLVDKNKWLKQSKKQQPLPEISWLCKANEPCQKDEECVSKPSCMDKYLQSESTSCCNVSRLFDSTNFQHSASDNMKWIVSGGQNVQPTTIYSNTTQNLQGSKREISHWLKTDQPTYNKNSPSITSSSFRQVHNRNDMTEWLKKDQIKQLPQPTTPADSCSLFSKFAPVHDDAAGFKKWLSSSSEIDRRDSIVDCNIKDEDKEKWLFKSVKLGQNGQGDGGIWFRAADDIDIEEIV